MTFNIGLIFQEGPIARSYLEVLSLKKIKINKLYYLNNNLLFSGYLNSRIKFYTTNSFAIKFLSVKNNISFLKNLQNYFHLSEDFFQNIYLNKIIKLSKFNCDFVGESLNSDKFIQSLKKDNNEILLNTTNKIYKDILNYKNNILHIHPGFLPDIRGADASLWSILKLNCFSSSAIYINKKIDEGKILYREKLAYKKFKLDNIYSENDLHKIWFSFIDPAIRSSNLMNILENNILLSEPKIENIEGEYFSFMENKSKINLLKDFFF
ncbi:hypothetical protein [Candidatus Pelagibacter sp. HIMB1748]|uniref:hypothetical protein n=1 Tax=unclassified Candidatus Pelagibacter TaxID=2647897 RepID=UPI003F86A32E